MHFFSRRLFLMLLVCWCLPIAGWGQALEIPSQVLDSLARVRQALRRPGLPLTQRVDLLLKQSFWLKDYLPDSTELVDQRALRLSRLAHYPLGEIAALNRLAFDATRRDDAQGALHYLTEAVARARATGEQRWLSTTYSQLAGLAFNRQDFPKAVEWARMALAQDSARHMTPSFESLGTLMAAYLELRRPDAARPLLRAMRQQISPENPMVEFQTLGTWASGIRHTLPDTAVVYARKALALAQRLRHEPAQSYAYLILIQALAAGHRWAEVKALVPAAMRLLARFPNPGYEAEIQLAYADALHYLSPTDPAGFRALRQVLVLNDTLFGQAQSEALATAQARFDLAEKQARIERLEQQRQIQQLEADRQSVQNRLVVVVAAVLAAGLLVGSGLYHRLRKQRAVLAAQAEELRRVNSTKDQLIAVVGHDLRSPATALLTVAPLLRRLGVGEINKAAMSIVDGLDASAHQLSALLDTLLQWAQAQTGILHLQVDSLAASELLQRAAAPYAAQAALGKVQLETLASDPALAVKTDPRLALTVLRNLIANAVKFTPSGGCVRLAVEAETVNGRPGVRFTVADSGPGFEAELAARLLAGDENAASVVPSARGARGEAGTGLGLPLSVRFARLLGGEVQLLQTSPTGTTMGCWLPG